ncbi:endonuclease/exonuclease/phosphatase family protein [Bacillus gobiensis]|uniref:endonuclease/exonuclease/phosphatase family protein n=1 Tax=Bacillus gobiensis TaxID=1441095 RepID=UPI003D1FE3D3
MDIKVMTFNIHHGKGTDKKVDLNRIAKIISGSKADVIGVNEVDVNFSKRSNHADQIRHIAQFLNFNYVYSPAIERTCKKTGLLQQFGNGLLSRYPILAENHHFFNVRKGLSEGRSLLEATVEINNRLINFYVTHLSLNTYLHKKQTEFIVKKTKESKHPVIILGDWNMSPHTKRWKRMTSEYTDAWAASGKSMGYTFPSARPRKRLDYIFVGNQLQVVDAAVVWNNPEASDHLPIVTTLAFN